MLIVMEIKINKSLQPKLIILFLWKTNQNPFQPNYPIFVEKQNNNRFLIILIVFCRAKLTDHSCSYAKLNK